MCALVITCIPFTFPLREVGGTPEATVVVLAAGRSSRAQKIGDLGRAKSEKGFTTSMYPFSSSDQWCNLEDELKTMVLMIFSYSMKTNMKEAQIIVHVE